MRNLITTYFSLIITIFKFLALSLCHPHVEVEYERETEPLTAEQLSQW